MVSAELQKSCGYAGITPWERFTICEVSEEDFSVTTNVKRYNAINQLINAKYWSVGNRNKSVRGRFKIWMVLNLYIYIYIAIQKSHFLRKVENVKFYMEEIRTCTGFATLGFGSFETL